ncbi:ComF family protein [Polynucleobacter necessarius]|uniref:ComF family protein n=1 Tax=Polynucleobacter necessarius TaxID=576610 RepID=UPI001E616172|nr:hypothetical protein [Polynucleobacter necessarius]
MNRHSPAFILPVPLSNQKLLSRGFNQSWEIARKIRCHDGLQKLPYALRRHHRANDQAKKLPLARQDAVHGLFYIDSKFQERLMGKTIIVFDDVMTSGATLNEIARTLKSIEVLRVVNWVLLRTTRPV